MPTNNQQLAILSPVTDGEATDLVARALRNTSYLIPAYNKIAVWNPNTEEADTELAMAVLRHEYTLHEVNLMRKVTGQEPIQAITIQNLQAKAFTNCGQFVTHVEPLFYTGEEPWVDEVYFTVNHSKSASENTFRKVSDVEGEKYYFSNMPVSDWRPSTEAEIKAAIETILASGFALRFRNLLLKGADPAPAEEGM